jgi:hypothetical protein
LATRTQKDITSKLGLSCVVLDPDDYDLEELSQWKDFSAERQWILGFFMATYGEVCKSFDLRASPLTIPLIFILG